MTISRTQNYTTHQQRIQLRACAETMPLVTKIRKSFNVRGNM